MRDITVPLVAGSFVLLIGVVLLISVFHQRLGELVYRNLSPSQMADEQHKSLAYWRGGLFSGIYIFSGLGIIANLFVSGSIIICLALSGLCLIAMLILQRKLVH